MIELYHSPFSTCSQKVRLCLAEKDVEWSERRIEFSKGDHLSEEYLKLNPNGVVPTLVHDGRPVIDSSVICEYLEEEFPVPALMPRQPVDRAAVRAWMRYIEEVPTASVRVPSFNKLFSGWLGAMSDEAFGHEADRRPLRKHFYRKMTKGRFSEEEYDASLERLGQTIARMEAALAQTDWVAGDMFSLADIILVPLIIRMEDLGLSDMWDAAPHVADWLARVKRRPSFDIAFYPGARITPKDFSFSSSEPA